MLVSSKIPAQARPALLRRVNRERVVRDLQTAGPLSRSELARLTGLGYATVVKICDSLESGGFAESCAGQQQDGVGRPGNYLRILQRVRFANSFLANTGYSRQRISVEFLKTQ